MTGCYLDGFNFQEERVRRKEREERREEEREGGEGERKILFSRFTCVCVLFQTTLTVPRVSLNKIEFVYISFF